MLPKWSPLIVIVDCPIFRFRPNHGKNENEREIENPDPLDSLLHRIGLGECFPTHYRPYLYDEVLTTFFLWRVTLEGQSSRRKKTYF